MIQNLQTSQGYIFHILQHFSTKLYNFTKFKMLFNAVVMNFTISKFFKILSITLLCNRSIVGRDLICIYEKVGAKSANQNLLSITAANHD